MISNILILRFPYTSNFGGTEKHTLDLFSKLKERRVKFFLLTSSPILYKEFKKRNWPAQKIWAGREPVTLSQVFLFPFLAPLIFLRLWPLLFYYRFFHKTKILYCLSFTEKLILTLPARFLGYKIFWIEHVIPGRWLKLNPFRPLYVFNSHFVKIIAVSWAVKNQLIKLKIKEKKIKTIYNGIDLTPKKEAGNYQNLAQISQFNYSPFTVGTVCRLHKEKGIEYLLGAIKIAANFIPNLQLIILGDGPEKKNLIWLTKKLEIDERVKFVGFQKNPTNWINNFEIFILPTAQKEAFGIVLLEAMAQAKPVIATKVGGIPEVVLDQITGLLVEPKKSEAIADALIYLFAHPEERKRMGENGRKRVETFFTLEKMVEEYYQEFKGDTKRHPERMN